MKRIRDRGPLLLVAAALLWSFSGLFVKSVSWDSLSISAVRGMVAFVLISAVRRPFPIRLNRDKGAHVGLLCSPGRPVHCRPQ